MRTAADEIRSEQSAGCQRPDNTRRKGQKGTRMISRTRNQITIQSRQTILVRPSRDSFRAWCERCLEVVAALTPESVTNLLGVPASRLCELLARDRKSTRLNSSH